MKITLYILLSIYCLSSTAQETKAHQSNAKHSRQVISKQLKKLTQQNGVKFAKNSIRHQHIAWKDTTHTTLVSANQITYTDSCGTITAAIEVEYKNTGGSPVTTGTLPHQPYTTFAYSPKQWQPQLIHLYMPRCEQGKPLPSSINLRTLSLITQ